MFVPPMKLAVKGRILLKIQYDTWILRPRKLRGNLVAGLTKMAPFTKNSHPRMLSLRFPVCTGFVLSYRNVNLFVKRIMA